MNLYLMRHGRALMEGQRPLSDQGRSEVESVSGFLSRRGIKVRTIYHSGKTRAEETARIMSSGTHAGAVTPHADLAPNDHPRSIAEVIKTWEEDTMIVGHLPHLDGLASLLLAGRERAAFVNFSCASILNLERDEDGSWAINWMIDPALLDDV